MNQKILKKILVTICILSIGCGTKTREEAEGTVTVNLDHIFGMQLNGSRDPGKDAPCREKFSKYIGKPVKTQYKINPQTQLMSATTSFEGKTFELSALGLEGQYSFGIFRPEKFPEAYSVIFTISAQFNDPKSQINLYNGDYNCLLSNAGDLFK